MLRSTVQAGWYEGSLFFVIVGMYPLVFYQSIQNPVAVLSHSLSVSVFAFIHIHSPTLLATSSSSTISIYYVSRPLQYIQFLLLRIILPLNIILVLNFLLGHFFALFSSMEPNVNLAVLNYKWSMTGLIDGPDKGTNSSLRNGIAAIKYVLDNTQKSCFGHLLGKQKPSHPLLYELS
jgi:hypothetical protein